MSPEELESLRDDWRTLLTPLGVSLPVQMEEFDRLAERYSSPGRHYHTLDHVAEVLAVVRRLIHLADNADAVRLAAWYHDYVYDPRAGDNEERSAEAAADALKRMALAPLIDPVKLLIPATKRHDADSTDAAVLLDADLAILGAEPERYDRYAADIRREYDWVPERQYREGRAAILRRFLARPRIYRTEAMHSRAEERARSNLIREIAALEQA